MNFPCLFIQPRNNPDHQLGVNDVKFLFADCVLDTDRRELTRGSKRVAVGPQVFDLLVHLVRNRDRVVSKDDLLETVWAGRVVSESTLSSHINAVRKAVGDRGADQSLIRTMARKGFRFVGQIKEERLPSADTSAEPVLHPGSAEPQDSPTLPLPDKPSIAVLPFANLSGDPEQEYFADGMVEDIIPVSRARAGFSSSRATRASRTRVGLLM